MSWVDGAAESRYGIHNLPYGVFTTKDDPRPRIGVRIADQVLDLRRLVAAGTCPGCPTCTALSAQNLNLFMAQGHEAWSRVRGQLIESLSNTELKPTVSQYLTPLRDVTMRMPFIPADYVDFYSSEHHARNLGALLRPGTEPLTPNWKHLPIGYHGRAGSIVPSGTDVIRPYGQCRNPDGDIEFRPSAKVDIEAEVGFVVGTPSRLGTPVPTDAFSEHVFGVVLVNDWSARDIQPWENQPLGPFLAKSFATSIGTWVTPLDALAAARTPAPQQDPPVSPYLKESDRFGYELGLEVTWNGTTISHPRFADMYWTPAQQLAHMTVNGARLRTGDFYASGTVSGPERDQYGSFMELSWNGTENVTLADGQTRTFIADGDTVTISANAPGPRGATIGLGEVTGTVRPARN